ncbi:hypothetical protein GIB67_001582, partial [Kingdonia uniflora]
MYQPNYQRPGYPKPFSLQESSTGKSWECSEPPAIFGGEMINGDHLKQKVILYSKILEDDMKMLGLKIEYHNNNIKFLKTEIDKLDESILDMQVSLGKYHSSSVSTMEEGSFEHFQSEENTIEQILQKEKSAAGVLCHLKKRQPTLATSIELAKDVVGIVATLGKVGGENLSRLFSEYIGLDTMMAIVCKTLKGVKALETYDKEGRINKICFPFFCRPYVGDFVANDPQRRLALLKPRLPTGECPHGFLGFAVNMIDLESINLSCLTINGHGLRETLFYSLFSRVQVYKTRSEMQLALPCISEGALSLDGGMIRSNGVFALGNRNEVEVRFPISSGSPSLPGDYLETQERAKLMKWERDRFFEDMQREHTLLNHVKITFEHKKDEFLKLIADGEAYVSQ